MTVATELAKLAGALALLAGAFWLFRPWPTGPVWKGEPMLVADCAGWQNRLQLIEPRTAWNHKRFEGHGFEATVYNRNDIAGGGLVLMLRQATSAVTGMDHCHIVTVSEKQGFARLSLSRAELRDTQDSGLELRVDTGITEDYRHGEPLVMGYLVSLRLSPETGALTATFK